MTDASPIPSRFRVRAKQRLRVLELAGREGIHAASRHFGITRKTVRVWRDRYAQGGLQGVFPRYPKTRRGRLPEDLVALIREARVERGFGAARTRIWLRRVHGRIVHVATVQRAFRRLGFPYLPNRSKRRQRPRQMKLFEKAEPGESVQVDVNFVRVARTANVSVHRPGRLHAVPRPAALPPASRDVQYPIPRGGQAGHAAPDPHLSVRQ